MFLLERYIEKELDKLIKKKIRLKIIGNINKFPLSLKLKLKKAELLTEKNSRIQVNIALNYGSKEEIVKSIKKINKLSLKVNEKNITDNLYTKNIPDPEILIRTGDRYRLSNFIMAIIYTEIFLLKLWPDFNKRDFIKILSKFKYMKLLELFDKFNEF